MTFTILRAREAAERASRTVNGTFADALVQLVRQRLAPHAEVAE
ncbi:MAG: hypothetical protein ABI696_17445 [Rubrivivax sp.]